MILNMNELIIKVIWDIRRWVKYIISIKILSLVKNIQILQYLTKKYLGNYGKNYKNPSRIRTHDFFVMNTLTNCASC